MNNDKVMFEDWEYEYMNEMIKIDTINNIKNDFQEEFDKKEKKYKDNEKKYKDNEKKYKAELSNNEKRYKDNERKSILNMVKEGFDNTVISRITGKSIKEIEKILM